MHDVKKIGYNENLNKQDFIGYDFQWQAGGVVPINGYSYYKVFGKRNDDFIVQTINNQGGSGIFSTLNLVKRVGNSISIKRISGGDRCSGGIGQVAILQKNNENYLQYQLSLTPWMLFQLSDSNPHHLQAYIDLGDCTSCCIGRAIFERTMTTPLGKRELKEIYLDKPLPKPNTEYEACLFKLLKSNEVQSPKYQLTKQDLITIMNKFNDQCTQ